MSKVKKILCLCQEFYEEIIKPAQKKERDFVISRINEFLAMREELLQDLSGAYSIEEQRWGRQICDYEKKIKNRLEELKKEIQQDILIVKGKKRNTPKYINPYQSVSIGAVFLDKKK